MSVGIPPFLPLFRLISRKPFIETGTYPEQFALGFFVPTGQKGLVVSYTNDWRRAVDWMELFPEFDSWSDVALGRELKRISILHGIPIKEGRHPDPKRSWIKVGSYHYDAVAKVLSEIHSSETVTDQPKA